MRMPIFWPLVGLRAQVSLGACVSQFTCEKLGAMGAETQGDRQGSCYEIQSFLAVKLPSKDCNKSNKCLL